MRRKVNINAVRESELRNILQAIGLADNLENGDLYCPETGVQLSWDNLGAMKVVDGSLVLYSIGAEEVVLGRTGTD